MKTEDFDRLKSVCEKEGFELLNESANDNDKFFIVKKAKDIWEGVAFGKDKDGKIVSFIANPKLLLCKDCEGNYIARNIYTPSTESAYIEQLKSECFKRFSEIKEGDRFDRSEIKEPAIDDIGKCSYTDFRYFKDDDSLEFGGIVIYQSGKWATRVKERVKVKYSHYALPFASNFNLSLCFLAKDPNSITKEIGDKMASKLEEYLNKE